MDQGYILVVEDVPDILRLLEETLKFKGYHTVTARNGQEALNAIQEQHPRLVITDIMMPKLDGFGLVHRLRINPETRDIPIIFLTATYVALEDRAFALSIGVTRFIEKPVNFEKFLKTIEELLTQDVPETPSLLGEAEFYAGYRQRLERKLEQKNAQITRDENLLGTLSEMEQSTFQASLQIAIDERDELRQLLDDIHKRMASLAKPE